MKTQESMENYLETIFLLEKRSPEVRSIDIANALGFSKPSISNAMKKLKQEGYINMEDRGLVSLTDSGRQVAMDTYEKHCVLTKLLTEFGVSREIAMEDACRMEHVISKESFDCIKTYIKENNLL